jgi:hypothetical protein
MMIAVGASAVLTSRCFQVAMTDEHGSREDHVWGERYGQGLGGELVGDAGVEEKECEAVVEEGVDGGVDDG